MRYSSASCPSKYPQRRNGSSDGRNAPPRLLVSAAYVWIGCLPFTALQAQGGSGSEPPYATVNVDLNGRAITQVLPFDVPFLLEGTVDRNVTAVMIEYREWCDKNAGIFHRNPEDCSTFPPSTWSGGGVPMTWEPFGTPSGEPQTFRVRMPALDAQRYFHFRFTVTRRLPDSRVEGFRKTAAQLLSNAFDAERTGTLTANRARDLRRSLGLALKSLLRGDEIVSSSTLFAPDADFRTFDEEFRDVLVPIKSPQAGRDASRRNHERRIAELSEALYELQANVALQRFVDSARAFAPEEGTALADAFATAEAQLSLLTMTAEERDRIARGRARRADDSPEPTALSDSSAVAAFAARYEETRTQLADLRDFLRALLAEDARYAPYTKKLLDQNRVSAADLASSRAFVVPNDNSLSNAAAFADAAAGNLIALARQLASRARAIDAAASRIELVAQSAAVIEATTTGQYSTIRNSYVSADAGVSYGWELGEVVPYVAVNIYFRPVNKNAPLAQRGGLGRRFALSFGLARKDIHDSRSREGLFGKESPLFGFGFRATQSIRVGVGGILLKQYDPNPLISEKRLVVTPYASMSFDVDVANLPSTIGRWFEQD